MSAWSHTGCDPVNPVFTAVPWELPGLWVTVIKTLVSPKSGFFAIETPNI
jgi:phosphatidate cytidylyltransferase